MSRPRFRSRSTSQIQVRKPTASLYTWPILTRHLHRPRLRRLRPPPLRPSRHTYNLRAPGLSRALQLLQRATPPTRFINPPLPTFPIRSCRRLRYSVVPAVLSPCHYQLPSAARSHRQSRRTHRCRQALTKHDISSRHNPHSPLVAQSAPPASFLPCCDSECSSPQSKAERLVKRHAALFCPLTMLLVFPRRRRPFG